MGLRWLAAKELKGSEIHPLLAPFQAARCRVADAAAFGTAAMTLEPGLRSENILVLDDTVPLQMRGILGTSRSVGLPLGPECHAISIFCRSAPSRIALQPDWIGGHTRHHETGTVQPLVPLYPASCDDLLAIRRSRSLDASCTLLGLSRSTGDRMHQGIECPR